MMCVAPIQSSHHVWSSPMLHMAEVDVVAGVVADKVTTIEVVEAAVDEAKGIEVVVVDEEDSNKSGAHLWFRISAPVSLESIPSSRLHFALQLD